MTLIRCAIGGRTCRIGLNSARLDAVPILTPFPDIPFHVVQSPGIGKLLPDRVNGQTGMPEVQNHA